jgi:hypothetical protein
VADLNGKHVAKLRVNFRTQKDELNFYKGVVLIGELMAKRASMMNQMLELDKSIASHVANIKPYKTWDEIGEMLNMSGFQAKKYFGDLMPEHVTEMMEEK